MNDPICDILEGRSIIETVTDLIEGEHPLANWYRTVKGLRRHGRSVGPWALTQWAHREPGKRARNRSRKVKRKYGRYTKKTAKNARKRKRKPRQATYKLGR